ncbi:MAG: ATP-binding cassette domain-containing protein [Methylococcaceae bacterium]|nr:MAG: ATP-binding cassette domain-containing protein [Methylococcaceae bacterium]
MMSFFSLTKTLYGDDAGGKTHGPLWNIFHSPDLRKVLPILMLAASLYNVLGLALPMAILQIMDRVVINQSLETLAFLVIGVVLGLIAEELLRGVNLMLTSWLGARFEHHASVGALERLMRVPLRHLQREEPGVHAERMEAVSGVADFYSGQALLILLDLPFVLIFLGMVYLIGRSVVLVPVVLLAIFVGVIVWFGRWMQQQVAQRYVLNDRRRNFLVEVFSGMHSVKAMAMEAQMKRRYERLQAGNVEMTETLANGSAMAAGIGQLFSQLMIVSIVFTGALGVLNGLMTPGGLAACMMLSIRSLQPLRRGLTVWIRYQSFVAAQRRLQEIAEMPCADDSAKPDLPQVRESLLLNHVTLRRSKAAAKRNNSGCLKGEAVFQDLSLEVPAGECIAIQGDSGSGKSSLLALMCGANQPDAGEILLDGQPLTAFNGDSVQREIGLLPQSGVLLSGTILENMTMFNPALNEAALDLAGQLGLDRAITSMKLGYETPIGEGNTETLPAGTRQIIAIIRVLVNNPSVILFDEANHSMDMEEDRLLREYLAQRKGIATLILVTHRPSMLSLADRLLVIDDGLLVDKAEYTTRHVADVDERPFVYMDRPEHMDNLTEIIHQHCTEESDFSHCLAPLLRAVGWKSNAGELMEAMPHLQRNLNLSGLCSIMANLGFSPHSFTSRLDHLDRRLMPCLFVPANAHAGIVLEKLADGRLRCFDSAGNAEIVRKAGHEAGEVYLFKARERQTGAASRDANVFGSLLFRFKRHILLTFVLTLLCTLFALTPPLFVKSVYDLILPTGDVYMQSCLLLGVLIVLGMGFYTQRLRSRLIAYVGGRAEYILGARIFRQVINLPASSTSNVSVRRQVGRMRNFESLHDFFMGPLVFIAFDMPANLIMLVMVGLINPLSLLVILCAGIAFFLLSLVSKAIIERGTSRSSLATRSRSEFFNEAITQMSAIRSAGGRALWLERYRDISGKAVMANFLNQQMHARISGAAQLLGTLTGFAALAVSAVGIIRGELSSGTMIATMMLMWRLVGPMQSAFMAANSMINIRSTTRQIQNLMQLPLEGDSGVSQTIRPVSQGALSFSRVSFRYLADSDPALLGISFAFAPRQMVVITGPNGSGKSSLLKLMTRAFTPQAGTIRLDGVDIRQLTVADLRARISYMPQKCDIFYGTVTQNLRLAYPAATDAEVHWAAHMAGLFNESESMPNGLDTRISNSSSEQLPKGYLQRLALARVMLKPAPLVLLDEPGSGLDQAGEAALLRCIDWLRERSTLIMVSHRPAHMRLADVTIALNRGSIAAMGAFENIKGKIF